MTDAEIALQETKAILKKKEYTLDSKNFIPLRRVFFDHADEPD